MTPRVIGFVINTLEVGGAERLLIDLVTRLDRRRFRPIVFSAFGGGTLASAFRDAQVPVMPVGKRMRFGVDLIVKLAMAFRREGVQIVHTHLPAAGVYGGLAAFLAGVPVVLHTEHHVIPWSTSPFSQAAWKLVQPRLALTIAVSRSVAEYLKSAVHLNGSRVKVIYNGVDSARFAAAARPIDGITHAVIIGRLFYTKGHAVALDALRMLRECGRRLTTHIVGAGPLESALRRTASEFSLDVVFRGEQEEIVEELRRADLVIVPSTAEGLPLTVLEAMAADKMVVASRVGGIPEVITDGVDGMLVPPGDASALAAVIAWIMDHPDEAARMAQAAMRKVQRAFDIQHTVAAYEAVYDDLSKAGIQR